MPVNWWQHVFLLAFDFCVKFLDHPKKLFLNQYSCFVSRSIWKVCLYPKRYTFCTLRFDSLDDVVELIFIQFLWTIIFIINLKIKRHDEYFCAPTWVSVLCCPPSTCLCCQQSTTNKRSKIKTFDLKEEDIVMSLSRPQIKSWDSQVEKNDGRSKKKPSHCN